jgi:ATP-dependent Clp protease adaptor protein ClpS
VFALKSEQYSKLKTGLALATKTPPPPRNLPRTEPRENDDGGSVVMERRPEKTKPPQMYQVALMNDDYTPMEFVVAVIQEFFSKDRETATQIMLKIHMEGKGVCGVFSKDVAATKVDRVMEAAQKAGHPLQCVSEPTA